MHYAIGQVWTYPDIQEFLSSFRIAGLKLHSIAFKHIASSGGIWVNNNPNASKRLTVIERLFNICYCEYRDTL